jgi:signal peptidase II
MKRKEWFLTLAPLFLVWFVDHACKLWGESLVEPIELGYIKFQLYHNHGAFLGFFSDLPPLLRIVSLSTIGSFLVFSYAIIQYMLPIKSLRLRLGLSILIGGIIGNVFDRILWGYVVDFIILNFSFFKNHPMNLADMFQWIGYGLVATALIRDDQLLWPEQNHRKRLWINHSYQLRYIFFLMIITLSLTLIGAVFSFTYLKVTIFELIGENRYVPGRFLVPFVFTYFAISFIFCFFLAIIGRKISHRNAGPIYAFDKYVTDLLDGRNRRFKLRSGDEFKELEALGAKISEFLFQHKLIDEDDYLKTLTTQAANADDFSIPAVPIDEQIPNYALRGHSKNDLPAPLTRPRRKSCPVCTEQANTFPISHLSSKLVECPKCNFVFDPHPVSLAPDSATFDVHDSKLNQWINVANFRVRLQRALKVNPKIQSYLEVGCGRGDALQVATDNKFNLVHGIESSHKSCESARSRGFQVFQGTLTEVGNLLSTYDLIHINSFLEKVDDPKAFIAQCHKLLSPAGILIIHTPNTASWAARLLKQKWQPTLDPRNVSFFSPEAIRKIIGENGLTIVSLEKSTNYLSLGVVARSLSLYGLGWIDKLVQLLPEFLSEKLMIPMKMGNILVITKDKASNL